MIKYVEVSFNKIKRKYKNKNEQICTHYTPVYSGIENTRDNLIARFICRRNGFNASKSMPRFELQLIHAADVTHDIFFVRYTTK